MKHLGKREVRSHNKVRRRK